ncbi:histidine kinase [Blastococcus sp. TF02A-30]|nr:histidine kinase [Blastococcus sp. TF02A-30]
MAASVLAAASGSHLEATLHEVVRAAVRHVDATYGALGVLTADGRALDRFVVVGMGEEEERLIGRLPAGEGLLGLLVAEPVTLRLDDMAAHPAFSGFPPGHPPMRSFLGVPLRVHDTVFGNLYLTEKRQGVAFTEADVEVTQALAAVAGLAIENARLLERAERHRAWGQTGMDIATALLSGADPDEVLRSAASRVKDLSGAEAAGVMVPAPGETDVLRVHVAVGPDAADVEGVQVPLNGGLLSAAHRTGVPQLIEDVMDPELPGSPGELVDELGADYGPILLIPVGGPPALGTLAALRGRGRPPFDEELLELAGAFAAHATVAMELVRSQQRERRLQLQADRDRIARDLHDHVVQRIYATGLALDRISRSLEAEHPEVAARIAERVDELDGTIARIRTSIFELHAIDDPADGGVRRRLAEVVRSVVDGHGLRRDLRIQGELDKLPAELVTDVVAVVRELVTNVVRHARARRVVVAVTIDGAVRVQVTDDGRGLPPVAARSGLANLAHRAERRGGCLRETSGRSGTQIEWEVPLP